MIEITGQYHGVKYIINLNCFFRMRARQKVTLNTQYQHRTIWYQLTFLCSVYYHRLDKIIIELQIYIKTLLLNIAEIFEKILINELQQFTISLAIIWV